ncbi:hypothetical protein AMES_2079 [Amycolatopsis mediterranei S699]|uniref:Uncharacterized protein n=2 Tax=Amycolatopsis mediterranei TaxID=33910 RepID=A0A0H3CZ42_AMYMU|nr:hypothetical protein [Amycolatopsis mediterranei]ADJ43902.1 conserved hypothetical protein [Amycolatopsis mediterranei U32]AEK40621.1 hypothetical protein RAM_10655 [Amycolatopsis mediterranei S699]AFO75615.1 hypothetical protein AMES_2079 [Amycolatopsis mediterranei S699]AGT82744.1 hypothetical protein B737_2080 [Amycolatopsis mediterranei RB]KDO09090.1 hypothetical protein DV26_19185 [Amycolatopsis mediterranei]
MRLVRLERQQSRVADDIRAALASLGRGSTVIGGIALVGVGGVTDRPIEAVVLLPHGVIIVIGVDLPDPALRLEAPLGGPWKADGWPLVADDDSVNPATEALDISQACERQIAALVPGTAPVGTIIAVGPYVETVDQPAADLAGPVRVLHPTPTTMLAATVSLATAHRPRSVDQVRALIRGLAPSAPEFTDEVLLAEGFSRLTDDSPPESLWDDGPQQSPPAPAGAVAAAAPVGVGTTDWRTTTPVGVAPSPAVVPEAAAEPPAGDRPAGEPSAAEPPAAEPSAAELPETAPAEVTEVLPSPVQAESDRTDPSVETEPTELLPRPLQTEPGPADPSARPVFPGTESTSPSVEAEPTEVLPTEAEHPTEAGSTTSQPAPPPTAPEPPRGSSGPLPAASPQPFPRPRPKPEPAVTPRTVRWLPLGAIGALVLLVVAAVVVATTGDDTAAAPAPPPATSKSQPPPTTPVRSLQFALRAAGGDQRCASHAFGDTQASLQQTSCSGVKRASYAATVDGRGGAVTVGVVDFPDAAQAAAFKAVADTPGGGGVLDLATETGQWGATPVPRFENAAYASKLDGSSVRLVQAVWAPGPSTPDDPGLVRAATAALDLPAQ